MRDIPKRFSGREGFPGEEEMMESMMKQLGRLGYDLGDEAYLAWAMQAYEAALAILQVRNTARRDGAPGEGKIGRNDPCPCGSGRKYKKCCLSSRSQTSRAIVTDSETGLPDWLVPRVNLEPHYSQDLGRLEGLLLGNRQTAELSFSPRKCSRHHRANAGNLEGATADERIQELERLAYDYVEANDERNVLGSLREAARKLARTTDDHDELRSLALAIVVSDAPAETSPLAPHLYRVALERWIRSIREEGDLVEMAGALLDQDVMRMSLEQLDELWRQRAPENRLLEAGEVPREQMAEIVRSDLEGILRRIFEGDFPVLAPAATATPLAALLQTRAQRDDHMDQDAFSMGIGEILERQDDDDQRLYGEILQVWLEDDDGSDVALTRDVRIVYSAVSSGLWSALCPALVSGSIVTGDFSAPPWELDFSDSFDLERGLEGEGFSPEYLESYGDMLRERGYPHSALRAWRTVGFYGEIPPSIQARIDKLKVELRS